MKKNKKILILSFVFAIMVLIMILPNFVYATDVEGIIGGMNSASSASVGDSKKIAPIINAVIYLLQFAGTGISIIVVTILGIKYMTASANEKAEVKKQAEPIVIGCILLFAAVNVVKIIASVGAGI